MFKESDHVEFVSAFLYQNLGLNVPADDITVQLSDTSFDKVTFDYDVDIDNLNCMLDLYISELIKHNASYSDSILLKQKIIYFLGVFKNFGFFTFDIRGYSNTLSPVKVIDIVSMIINDCEELSKANSSTDAIRNLYLDKMKVDGKVLVAKFALKQFFHSDFGDFISFVEKRITDCLNETLRIINLLNMALYVLGSIRLIAVLMMTYSYALISILMIIRQICQIYILSLTIHLMGTGRYIVTMMPSYPSIPMLLQLSMCR